jgi:hypothetical protein
MSHWNYRVIHRKVSAVNGYDEDTYSIHEVYYNDNGDIYAFSQEPVQAWSDTVVGLKWVLEKFQEAYNKPVLNYENLLSVIKNPNYEPLGITNEGE